VPASRLAEVSAGDAQPLVLGGRREHPLQELAVAPLQGGALAKRALRLRDARSQRVARELELREVGDSRLPVGASRAGLDPKPRKGLGGQPRELALEAADLPPQLPPSEALVACSKLGKRLPIEQIRHRSRV